MNEYEQKLFDRTATMENGAAFSATREGSLARVRPLTPRAIAWLCAHVPEHEDTTRYDDDLIVELRYFPALADAIIAAGFTFERDALPN